MNRVEPIRDINMVKAILEYLKEKNERDYIMVLIGLYSGLRISDILELKVFKVRDKKQITIREKKTNKQKVFSINPFLRKELNRFIEEQELEDDDYLITSRQKDKYGKRTHIGRTRAYQILNEVAERFGLDNIGTHTLRKTFGTIYYEQIGDILELQQIFNHSSPSITLRYIGKTQEQINKNLNKLKIL